MKNPLIPVFVLLLFTGPLLADSYPRQPGIDAEHYVFRVLLSDDTDEINGETTVDLRFLQSGVTSAVLDLTSVNTGKGMTVTEVTSGGAAVPYTHTADHLTLTLTAP